MAELTRPFPPGSYPVIVIGSGPGGLQVSYSLRQQGVRHAVLSADPAPGGMFRRWPFFQRLLSWTKPYAPVARGTRAYERYDWNSLLGEEEGTRAIAPTLMDGTSYFPSRPEMEANLAAFADRTALEVRYDCAGPRRGSWMARMARTGSRSRPSTAATRAGPWSWPSASPSRTSRPGSGWSTPTTTPTCDRPRPTPGVGWSSSASRTPGSSWPTACSPGRASSCWCRRRTPSSRSTRTRWSGSGRATCSRTRTTCWAAGCRSWTRRSIGSSATTTGRWP